MRKFTIISKKGVTTIQEVEIELVTSLEDPSVMWMFPGEYKAKVLKPDFLYEKQSDGRMTPPIWCWHAFHSTEAEARAMAESDLRKEMERVSRKSHLNEDVNESLERMAKLQEAFDKLCMSPVATL